MLFKYILNCCHNQSTLQLVILLLGTLAKRQRVFQEEDPQEKVCVLAVCRCGLQCGVFMCVHEKAKLFRTAFRGLVNKDGESTRLVQNKHFNRYLFSDDDH